MKKLLFLILVLFLQCTNKESKSTITLKAEYCKYIGEKSRFSDSITLYRNDAIVDGYHFPDSEKIELSKLKYGNYTIKYRTLFNQYVSTNFTINDDKDKIIEVCFDKISYDTNRNILLLDNLKNNEKLYYTLESQGCFHSLKKEIILEKKENLISLTYNKETKILSDKELNFIREFEIELRSNHIGWCSTKDRYSIYNDKTNEVFFMNDESCQWNGFYHLIKLLGVYNENDDYY